MMEVCLYIISKPSPLWSSHYLALPVPFWASGDHLSTETLGNLEADAEKSLPILGSFILISIFQIQNGHIFQSAYLSLSQDSLSDNIESYQ